MAAQRWRRPEKNYTHTALLGIIRASLELCVPGFDDSPLGYPYSDLRPPKRETWVLDNIIKNYG